MANIAEAIHARLSGDATLAGLLNGGIYPYTPSVTPERPYITYHLISLAERPHAMGSDPALVVDRYQVDIWADRYADMIAVNDEVHRLLSRWRGAEAGVTVNATFHVSRQDFFENDTEFFRRTSDYEIGWYE